MKENKTDGVKALVVTTAHRGVFFGYGTPSDAATIVLERARMCVYWSAELKGVCGLAAQGPSKSCRIGPAVPRLTLREVTAVMEATEDAAKNWEKELWS
jgi:hypothetical protein